MKKKKKILCKVIVFTLDSVLSYLCPPCPGLSGERVGLMTWWLRVRVIVEAKFLSGIFSPLTSAEAYEKSSRWLRKDICVSTGVRKPENTCASPTAII